MSTFAFADPPYLGQGVRLYGDHPEADIWDNVEAHINLINAVDEWFPDGWAYCLSSPSLQPILSELRGPVRVAAWVKPFVSFKPNVNPAYTWEPVIFKSRRRDRSEPTIRDHLSEVITLRKGLAGAKPHKFNLWILDLIGFQKGDEVYDLFPGTHGMSHAVAERNAIVVQEGLFA